MAAAGKTTHPDDLAVCPAHELAESPAGSPDSNGSTPSEPTPSHLTDASATRRIVSIRPNAPWSVLRRELPPGPRTPPLFQMLALYYRREGYVARCRARYGSRFTLRLKVPSVPYVVLSDPDDIKQMYVAPPDVLYAGDGSAVLEKYFGPTGLTFMEEDDHIARRRVVKRSVQAAVAKGMDAIAGVVEGEIASWPRDEPIHLTPRLLGMAVKAMRVVSFGPDQDKRLDELFETYMETMRFGNTLQSFALFHELPPWLVRLLTAIRPLGYRRFFELRARVDELIRDVVEDRRRAGADGDDLVSVLLSTTHEDGSPLSWVEVRDEVMTTFVAGSESTAATSAFAIERLAHEPAVRERLVNEIDAGEDDAYLTATVQEVLRLKPVVAPIPRLVMKPIEVGGWWYPPGVRLAAMANLVHTDPSTYPDPHAFRPERFLEKQPGTYTWIPFGGGRRRCLGRVIAQAEVKCVLREVLTRYEVHPANPRIEPPHTRTAVYLPGRGLRVTLTDRTRHPALATH